MNYTTIVYALLAFLIAFLIYRSFKIFREGLSGGNRIGKILFLIIAFGIVGFFLMMGASGIMSGLGNS